ncbi:MAG: hypothetical protein R2766_08360 [Saprospiraceae bacterium]
MKETRALFPTQRTSVQQEATIRDTDSPFSELLQSMVNTIIEGEMTAF